MTEINSLQDVEVFEGMVQEHHSASQKVKKHLDENLLAQTQMITEGQLEQVNEFKKDIIPQID